MIKFRQKDFSFLGHVTSGASLGAGVGLTVAKFRKQLPKGKIKDLGEWGIIAGSTLIGAALGAISGLFVEGDKFISKKSADKRLMNRIVDDLKKTGFREGYDFTLDPKKATEMKTRICLVVTRDSGELRILINSQADSKLNHLTESVIKNIPNTSAITKKATDKFNDITITTISDSSADVGLVAGLAEKFIRNKYPIYLVEVG